MDVNLDSNLDSIILYISVNDILQDSTPDSFKSYIKSMELMVQKCCAFGVKWMLSGIVNTKRTIQKTHNPFIDTHNGLLIFVVISALYMFKTRLMDVFANFFFVF